MQTARIAASTFTTLALASIGCSLHSGGGGDPDAILHGDAGFVAADGASVAEDGGGVEADIPDGNPAPPDVVGAPGPDGQTGRPGMIGPQGGVIDAGLFILEIPAGALSNDVDVQVNPSTVPGGYGSTSQAFDIQPAGLSLALPAKATFLQAQLPHDVTVLGPEPTTFTGTAQPSGMGGSYEVAASITHFGTTFVGGATSFQLSGMLGMNPFQFKCPNVPFPPQPGPTSSFGEGIVFPSGGGGCGGAGMQFQVGFKNFTRDDGLANASFDLAAAGACNSIAIQAALPNGSTYAFSCGSSGASGTVMVTRLVPAIPSTMPGFVAGSAPARTYYGTLSFSNVVLPLVSGPGPSPFTVTNLTFQD
jgi:hypothetical protein